MEVDPTRFLSNASSEFLDLATVFSQETVPDNEPIDFPRESFKDVGADPLIDCLVEQAKLYVNVEASNQDCANAHRKDGDYNAGRHRSSCVFVSVYSKNR